MTRGVDSYRAQDTGLADARWGSSAVSNAIGSTIRAKVTIETSG